MRIDLDLPEDIKKDISTSAEILLREGCTEIYIFGSLVNGTFSTESDIDIATVGLSKEKFFSAYGNILSVVRRSVDLVALDYDQDFGKQLRKTGILTRVA